MNGEDQGALDHRHQPARVLPQPGGARARASPARPARRAGRLRDAHHRPRRRRAPRRHLGREGGHLHELRASGVAGPGRGAAARARPAPTSTSSSAWPSASGCATALYPGLGRADGRVRGVAPGVRRSAVRLQRHHLRADRRGRRRAVALPRRRPDVPLGGSPRLYADGGFPNPTGKVRLHCVDRQELRDKPRPEFPLLLNTGRTVEHWHTRTKTARVPLLERLAPEAWVEINEVDADRPRSPHRRPRPGDLVPGRRSTASSPGSRPSCGPARCSSRSTTTRPAPTGSPSTSSTRSPASRTTSSAPSASSAPPPVDAGSGGSTLNSGRPGRRRGRGARSRSPARCRCRRSARR